MLINTDRPEECPITVIPAPAKAGAGMTKVNL